MVQPSSLGLRAAAVALLVLAGCGSSAPGGSLTAFCAQVDALTAKDPFATLGDSASPPELKLAFDTVRAKAGAMRRASPHELVAASKRYEAAVITLQKLLEDASYDGANVDQLSYRDGEVEYGAAAAAIDQAKTDRC